MKKSIWMVTGLWLVASCMPARAVDDTQGSSVEIVVRNRTKNFLMNPSGIIQALSSSKNQPINVAEGVIPGDSRGVQVNTAEGAYQLFFTPRSNFREKVMSCTGAFNVASGSTKQVVVSVYEQKLGDEEGFLSCRVEQQLTIASR